MSQSQLLSREFTGEFAANDATKPDTYYYDPHSAEPPPDDFVLVRDEQGNVVSRYGDDVIDMRSYSADVSGSMAQIAVAEQILLEDRSEIRWLWFINYIFAEGLNNNSLSPSGLRLRFYEVLRPLSRYARELNISSRTVLEDEKRLAAFLHRHQGAEKFCEQGAATFALYHQLGPSICGFTIAWTKRLKAFLTERMAFFYARRQQHPVIPPYRYHAIWQQAWSIVSEFESHKRGLERLIAYLVRAPSRSDDRRSQSERDRALAEFIDEHGLRPLADEHGWRMCDRRLIQGYLSSVQLVCKDLLHFYSGMRDNEVSGLYFHCLETDTRNKRRRARLLGNTSKYLGTKQVVKWATSIEVERVVAVLQTIARPIARILDVSLAKRLPKGERPCPLFLSLGYINNRGNCRVKHPHGKVRKMGREPIHANPLYDASQFVITDEDLSFLEKIDPSRDWRALDSDFAVGKVFPYSYHQFRRSLAVYAAQSGLVSIGSLQTQLKHLLREVSYYYANGAENARGVFDASDKNHMAQQYAQDKPTADFTAYVLDILFNPERLIGINGKVIERTSKANTPEKQQQVLANRKDTIHRFKKGQMAYKETPLGGCETTQPCDKKLLRSLTACIDCAKADIVPSKLQRTIDRLTIEVKELPPESVEYRTERHELDTLIAFRDANLGTA